MILVIDVSEETYKDFCWHKFMLSPRYKDELETALMKAKPLPKKKPTTSGRQNTKSTLALAKEIFNNGYNTCLKEIIGETDNTKVKAN